MTTTAQSLMHAYVVKSESLCLILCKKFNCGFLFTLGEIRNVFDKLKNEKGSFVKKTIRTYKFEKDRTTGLIH